MALTGEEHWDDGFVVDDAGAWVVTYNLTGAAWWAGFLRDPDGRLVIAGG